MTAQINNAQYSTTVLNDGCGPIMSTQYGDNIYLKLGDTTLTEDMLKELLLFKDFVEYSEKNRTLMGKEWTAYKAMKRITE